MPVVPPSVLGSLDDLALLYKQSGTDDHVNRQFEKVAGTAQAAHRTATQKPENSEPGLLSAVDTGMGIASGVAGTVGMGMMIPDAMGGAAWLVAGGNAAQRVGELSKHVAKLDQTVAAEAAKHIKDINSALNTAGNLAADKKGIYDTAVAGLRGMGLGTEAGESLTKLTKTVEQGSPRWSWLGKAGNLLRKPADLLSATMGDLGKAVGIGKGFGQGAAGAAGGAAKWVGDVTRINQWRGDANLAHSVGYNAQARAHLKEIYTQVKDLTSYATDFKPHIAEMSKALKSAHGATGNGAAEIITQSQEAYKKASDLLKGHAEIANVKLPMDKLDKSFGLTAEHSALAQAYRNPVDAFKNGVKNFSKRGVGVTAMNGAFTIGAGADTYREVRHSMETMDTLKQMEADKRGVDAKDVSGLDIVLSPEGRGHLAKNALKTAINGLGFLAMGRGFLLKGGHIGMPTFFAPMLANMGVDMVVGDSELVKNYKPFRNAFNQSGGKLSADVYAQYIALADPHFAALQPNPQAPIDPLTQKVAMQLAAEHKKPWEVAEEIKNNRLTVRADAIIATQKAPPPAPVAQPVAALPAAMPANTRVDIPHTHKPILGTHTRQYVERQNAPVQSLALPQPR